ncbi:AAA family ATPase [Streptosporangium sandarakinum]|uniref:AAA family ATPase n=1 Tax=Streptosporangium sandarakinum TaxID=1260955 RepID=UPI00368F3930
MHPATPPAMLAVEGPPGAGKTSLLSAIVPTLGDSCVFFTEPNARLAEQPETPLHSSTAAYSLWFLRHEQAKARRLTELAADPATRLLVCDRNHLGALAYCYATRAGDALPYSRARAFYTRHIAPRLPEQVHTVVLLVSPDLSLARRGGKAERALWQQWFHPDLLRRLMEFYTDVVPDLCPNPPQMIDTDQMSPAAVLEQVRAWLIQAKVAKADRLITGDAPSCRVALASVFTAAYTALGGLETFGHPITAPFRHRGGWIQMCQLGALHRDRSGRIRVWDPLAASRTAAVS